MNNNDDDKLKMKSQKQKQLAFWDSSELCQKNGKIGGPQLTPPSKKKSDQQTRLPL